MYKIKRIILCICLFGTFCTLAAATEHSNYSVAVELARAKKVDLLVERINELNSAFKLYVYNTGDINANITKINQWNGNLNSTSWENYDKKTLLFSHNERNVTFSTLFSSEPSKEVLSFLLNSSNITPLSTIDSVNYSITIPHDNQFMSFYKYTKELTNNPNVVISPTAPNDKTKIWYKPDGNGGYEIFGWSDTEGKWISYGKIGFNSNGSGSSNNNIVVKSMDELNSIPATSGLKAYVSDGGIATEYIYDGEKWVSTGNSSTGGLFNGDATILDLATSLINKSGGSIATVSDPFSSGTKNFFSGVKEFIKKDNSSTNGYWVDSTNSYIVGSVMADITTQSWQNGTIAYLPKSNKTSVDVLKRINSSWVYISDGYVETVQNMNEAKNYLVWDKRNNEYFKYFNTDFWASTSSTGTLNNITRLSSNNRGRDIFTSLTSNTKYHTLNNDCTLLNCNGEESNNFYAGEKIDGMFTFYFSLNGKRKNNLIDAQPVSSFPDLYDKNLEAGLINGVVYLKDKDNNGKVCYKDTNDNYYTKSGVKIPTGNNIPPSKTCSTAAYNGSYIILDNRTQATDWVLAPNGAGASILNTNYTYRVGSGLDFWTNNNSGDGQSSATEIFTKGARNSFPNVTHTINALTKNVDTPNYTTTGVVSSIDNTFKQWFYSNSGTRINNLLDNPCTTLPISENWLADFSNSRCKRDY
uniref:hypothetical protein n=1 Tax=Aliarcobacter butzleri TaxID=28197 RepID=UPI002B245C85